MRVLNAYEAGVWLSKYVPVALSVLATSKNDLVLAARKIGFPAYAKLISREALHKTEVGGVRIVHSLSELTSCWDDFVGATRKARISLQGVLVQEVVKGRELIVGVHNDPTFGRVIACGLGGVFVELLKDVVFRACPISSRDAAEMLEGLKGRQILTGFRNTGVNVSAVKDVLVRISKLPVSVESLDINPLMASEKDVKAVDVRMVLS